MMLRIAVLMMLASAAPCWAGLDPLPSESYRWRILLRTPKHPRFDDAFRDRLARELKAALGPKLGLLATLEIIDASRADDALARDFQAHGWPAFEQSRSLDNVKHHGLAIDVVDGAFAVSARQFDGFTGLVSPLQRTRTVHQADLIPRAAAMLIEPDFGLGATVLKYDATNNLVVTLTLRGYKLAAMSERVQPGDIFAASTIRERSTKEGTKLFATANPYTILKVLEAPKDGVCRCRVLSRFAAPFGRGAEQAAGIRAMKLATVSAPVNVVLTDKAGKPHTGASRLMVAASEGDAGRPAAPDFVWKNNRFESTREFKGVAVFSVGIGAEQTQKFPVPVLGQDSPIVLTFDLDAKAERRAEFYADCRDLRGRIADLNLSQAAMVTLLNQLIDTGRRKEALAKAEQGRDTFAELEKQLSEEWAAFKGREGANDPGSKETLDACGHGLDYARDGRKELLATIEKLKELNKPSAIAGAFEREFHLRDLQDRIKMNVEKGNIPEALALLEQLIQERPKDDAYKTQREQLQAQWAPKNDAHRAARDAWRQLDKAKEAEEILEACKAVRAAIPVLKANDDLLGMLKFNNSFERPFAELNKKQQEVESLPETDPNREDRRAKLEKASQELADCARLVRDACDALKAKRK